MTLALIGIGAGVATLIGGYFALYFKDRLHLILGYSAGAVIGVALFDLIPEAIDIGNSLSHSSISTMTYVAIGFALYLLIDRIFSIIPHMSDTHSHAHNHDTHNAGGIGPMGLIIHSFLDGLAIGIAFNVDITVGVVVAIAVLLHDFSDGINTVNLSLTHNQTPEAARRWLYVDAIMPILGIVASQFISIPDSLFSIIIAVFAGFFLYIGASELIPESQHRHPHFWTTFATLLGMLTLYLAIIYS